MPSCQARLFKLKIIKRKAALRKYETKNDVQSLSGSYSQNYKLYI